MYEKVIHSPFSDGLYSDIFTVFCARNDGFLQKILRDYLTILML
jgi:hypothetical protein